MDLSNEYRNNRIVITPHPISLDGQRNIPVDLIPGENLKSLLERHVPDINSGEWQVAIGGCRVPKTMWERTKPRNGYCIEIRSKTKRAILQVAAIAALTYFTLGAGTPFALGTVGGFLGATATFMAGALLINKVLGPKIDSMGSGSNADSVYNISGATNQARQYQPAPILFGTCKITPDLGAQPYTWYEGNEQYLGMVLLAGINVNWVNDIVNDDTSIYDYTGTKVYYQNCNSTSTDRDFPLYANADAIEGGTFDTGDEKNTPSAWIVRTSSINTVRIQINVEYQLYDRTSKGKDKQNQERIETEYRPIGTTNWQTLEYRTVRNSTQTVQRTTLSKDVPEGQYEVRARIAGLNTDGLGAYQNFVWTTLTSVQKDNGNYSGLARIGIRLQASDQLNSTPKEIRMTAHSDFIPVWKGSDYVWEESSNPGAIILKYARGYYDENGKLIAGMGLSDDMIDLERLKSFTLHCAKNNYTYDYYVKEVRNHQDMLSAIALVGMGAISWPSGKLSVVYASEDQAISGVVNMATIKEGQFQVDYTLASNAADGIEYTYIDPDSAEAVTLRVASPGITTMLNPSQITGEGVTSEAHAAKLARYHLAQSLYQYKDISYSTDMEHMSYGRMALLSMQHDLTQWGYGGRVVAASVNGGRVTLTLDESVPSPPSGAGYIGVRIPGELTYRVFQVVSFTGHTNIITLQEAWPEDTDLPGSDSGNPAHDTLWCYDFKSTPGYRVRVVSIEPESDFSGAQVTCVPESDEFWNYVNSGEYIPPVNQSLIPSKPKASNVKVTENQIIIGDTEYTELSVTFDVEGLVGSTIVMSNVSTNGELSVVAETITRTAKFRIPGPGIYTIVVRPYTKDSPPLPGQAATVAYTTIGAGGVPVNVDNFNVEQLNGGIRRYVWWYNSSTIQSPNVNGVEIRYTAGLLNNPAWETMTPLGSDGFHTSAFESTLPESGDWTFAICTRNTNGDLSLPLYAQKTLNDNLGQVLSGIEQIAADANTAISKEITDRTNALNQEAQLRLSGDQTLDDKITVVNGVASGNASAIQIMQVDLDNMSARAGVYVDANGRVIGWTLNNGQDSGDMDIVANRFRVTDPNNTGSTVFEDGRWVTRFGQYMNVFGKPFGPEYQFVEWFGIGSDPMAATADAATYYKTVGGDAVFKGNVQAQSITGSFQRILPVDWTGNITNGYTPEFTLPWPVTNNETHRPYLSLSISLQTGDGNDATSCVISLEKWSIAGSEWVTLDTRTYAIFKFMQIGASFSFIDQPTDVSSPYRFRITQGSGQNVSVVAIKGTILGIR